jgi:hypothetical protein
VVLYRCAPRNGKADLEQPTWKEVLGEQLPRVALRKKRKVRKSDGPDKTSRETQVQEQVLRNGWTVPRGHFLSPVQAGVFVFVVRDLNAPSRPTMG